MITETWPKDVDWFEAVSENYMDTGGRPLHILEEVRRHYPIALHGTALSIGSSDPLNPAYLERLKKLIERIDPFLVSDHLCWSGVEGEQLHDLLPLPFTEESIQHVVRRVQHIQEFLGRRFVLENVSTYVTYQHSAMPEWEFLTEVAKRSGCGLLLDINNVYVNATNHRFDPYEYLRHIPHDLIAQIHLAGHTDMGDFLFDTHNKPVIDSVWDLYREALKHWGQVSTLIEWDENIPPFEQLLEEVRKAKVIYKKFEGQKPVIARSFNGTTKQSDTTCHPEAKPKDLKILSATQTGEPAVLLGGRSAQNDSIGLLRPHSDSRLAMTNAASLLEIQHWLKLQIHPDVTYRGTLPENLLNSQGGLPGAERVQVYANGYPSRIRESLNEVYEAVHYVLGDEHFSDLCHAYAEHYHSRDYNLNFVGRHMAEFLKASPWIKEFPFLPDLAKLEWLIWEAFHAFDGEPFTPLQASKIPMEDWERAQFIFQPSAGLIASPWPILDIWRLRREARQGLRVDIKRSQQILVGRKNDQVRCELIDKNQYRLIEGLLQKQTLGAVCEALAEETEEEALPIAAWFSNWIQEGLILRCEVPKKAVLVAK
ncbi:MAG: hypothetical protein A3C35_07335 [Omnitrophica bacterium RIFCSPHIGHO2_02_FULL_46_11]|nr:MAG: hypothetical protein A3C35_07335 [Omnitrophica bacterium RIFCSPHIGHO2_02_FULL_46_11]OGW87364.1 MAG: hypothetical protein A3A81_04555 [Omnitrophica bacterium RIFCSPLOWO2_01_FULL_45_10b]